MSEAKHSALRSWYAFVRCAPQFRLDLELKAIHIMVGDYALLDGKRWIRTAVLVAVFQINVFGCCPTLGVGVVSAAETHSISGSRFVGVYKAPLQPNSATQLNGFSGSFPHGFGGHIKAANYSSFCDYLPRSNYFPFKVRAVSQVKEAIFVNKADFSTDANARYNFSRRSPDINDYVFRAKSGGVSSCINIGFHAMHKSYAFNIDPGAVSGNMLGPLNVSLLLGNNRLILGDTGLKKNSTESNKASKGRNGQNHSLDFLIVLPFTGFIFGYVIPMLVYKWPVRSNQRYPNNQGHQ